MQIQAIILEKKGDAKNLKNSIISLQDPKKNEVQIRHSAIGINFFDVCFRKNSLFFDFSCSSINFCGLLNVSGKKGYGINAATKRSKCSWFFRFIAAFS